MRYADIKYNDIANAPGICVSVYLQGCPHKCFGCFNPTTWDFNGGKEFTPQTLEEILSSINKNGVKRNLCILGGEPLCEENRFLTRLILTEAKKEYPNIKVYVWTGYVIEDLMKLIDNNLKQIFELADCIVDGPYVEDQRDITLKMRGSKNQRILYKGKDF